jgi:dihydroneopterin aldolase
VLDTVNYAELGKIAYEAIVGTPFNLIETLAEVIAKKCLELDKVQTVCVTVHKPSAPLGIPFDDVLVIRCLP